MIKTKKEMKERLSRGEFGNHLQCWSSLVELMTSGYEGLVYVRSNTAMDKGHFEIPILEVPFLDVDHSQCHYYEAPENRHREIQGEVYRNHQGLYLQYSLMKVPLRTALLTQPVHVQGLTAKLILEHMVPEHDKLFQLLDDHSGAIVEFTQFSRPVGVMGKRLVIWEVRNY